MFIILPDQIKETLEKNKGFGSNITISDESDAILETGGGLKKAGWFFKDSNEPFVVMNVDVLTDMNLKEMINEHKNLNPIATLGCNHKTYFALFFI